MREENSIWDNIPSGWCISGGLAVPPSNNRNYLGVRN